MKTIALLDHYHTGHHLAFIKLFSKYFLKLGYRVCVLFPEKENEIRDYLKIEGLSEQNFWFVPFTLTKPSVSALGRFNYAVATLRFWIRTQNALKKAEKSLNLKFDNVFLAWLDDYLANYLPPQAVDFFFQYRFSGLYFHPWYLNSANINNEVSISSVDSVLRSKKCMSVAIHDEFNVDRLSTRIKKKVLVFPEIADSTPAATDSALTHRLNAEASGRLKVGLIGISHRKGFPLLMEVIKRANPSNFFFLFSGKFDASQFLDNQIEPIQSFLQNVPDNCLYHPDYIAEGAELNAVIANLDVLFLVYNNFQSSSNLITKAALFKKIVVSGSSFWMGRVTKQYQLGPTVEEGHVDQALDALHEIKQDRDNIAQKCLWQAYMNVHTETRLETVLAECF